MAKNHNVGTKIQHHTEFEQKLRKVYYFQNLDMFFILQTAVVHIKLLGAQARHLLYSLYLTTTQVRKALFIITVSSRFIPLASALYETGRTAEPTAARHPWEDARTHQATAAIHEAGKRTMYHLRISPSTNHSREKPKAMPQ